MKLVSIVHKNVSPLEKPNSLDYIELSQSNKVYVRSRVVFWGGRLYFSFNLLYYQILPPFLWFPVC